MLETIGLHLASFIVIAIVLKVILDWLGTRGYFKVDWNIPPHDDETP